MKCDSVKRVVASASPWVQRAFCPCGHDMHSSFGDVWFAQQSHPSCPKCGGAAYLYKMKTMRKLNIYNGFFKFNTEEIEIKDEDAPHVNYKEECEAKDKRIAELERQLSERSWANNPDRSGGQFTEEEKNRPNWT